MKNFRRLCCLILVCGSLLSFTEIVDAATYWQYGCQSRTIQVRSYDSSYNAGWVRALDNARAAWNNSGAGTTILTWYNSNNTIQAAQFAENWYGLFTVNSASGPYITQFTIKLNARTISRDASNFDNFLKSTAAHEFGHAFFLDDNPPSGPSLMSHSRDRNTLTTPQAVDVHNVLSKYMGSLG